MSVRVSYKKQFIFGIMMLLVFLAVVEGLARIWEFVNPDGVPCYLPGRDAGNDVDPSLVKQICLDLNSIEYYRESIVLMKPNQHFQTFNINSHGFRGPETTIEKPENTFRIFITGGSSALSAGSTSDETSISGMMQKLYDEKELGVKVEVVNGATGGYTSLQENWLVKNKMLALEPDLIIFYDGGNDVRYRNLDTIEEAIAIFEEAERKNPFKFKSYPFYRTPFVIYRILLDPAINLGEQKDPLINEHIIEQVPLNWKNNIAEICEIGKKENFQVLVALQPLIGIGNKTIIGDENTEVPQNNPGVYKSLSLYPNMKNRLAELDSICEKTEDLTNIFDNVMEPLYYDDIHVNDKGNEMIANKLFELTVPMITEKIAK